MGTIPPRRFGKNDKIKGGVEIVKKKIDNEKIEWSAIFEIEYEGKTVKVNSSILSDYTMKEISDDIAFNISNKDLLNDSKN